MPQKTNPLGDASRMRRASTLGADSAGDGVLLQLKVVVHAGHLQRRAPKLKLGQGVRTYRL